MGASDRLPRGPFTLTDAASAGVSRASVYRLAATGALERLGPGLFVRPDCQDGDDALTAAVLRAPLATVCLLSALVHHDLVDAIAPVTDLAVPRGAYRPPAGPTVAWHQFDPASFDVGRTTMTVPGGSRVGVYDAPRTLVDVFRLRGVVGYEVGVEALRVWLRRPGCHPATLLGVAARLPRGTGPLRTALTYLA